MRDLGQWCGGRRDVSLRIVKASAIVGRVPAEQISAGRVDVVADVGARLGEGPVWDGAHGLLYWVDIPLRAVHRLDPVTGVDESVTVDRPVGALALRAAGGLVLAWEDGFATTDGWSAEPSVVVHIVHGAVPARFNDGKCDPAGRFWAGSMAHDERRGAGALYRLDPDHSVNRMLEGVGISNGLAWSVDGRTMFYIDTLTHGLDAFDFDLETGAISGRRRVVDVPASRGGPDGMTIDTDGCLWVALWGGSAVHRYTPAGRLDRVVPVPVTRVTSCTFGGPNLDQLYITTARHNAVEPVPPPEKYAGAVFVHEPGVTGHPAARFAG
jgi:sugar lactone lactonase YvrE